MLLLARFTPEETGSLMQVTPLGSAGEPMFSPRGQTAAPASPFHSSLQVGSCLPVLSLSRPMPIYTSPSVP